MSITTAIARRVAAAALGTIIASGLAIGATAPAIPTAQPVQALNPQPLPPGFRQTSQLTAAHAPACRTTCLANEGWQRD